MRSGIILLFLTSFLFGNTFAVDLREAEESLQSLLAAMRTAQDDVKRNEINQDFIQELRTSLKEKGAFQYPFDSLANYMTTMKAPDGKFRIFNWNVANNDFTHQYFCYVMYYDKREKTYRLEELKNRTENSSKLEDQVLFQTHWFGALYYKIVPVKKAGRTYYTVLGWCGKDRYVTQRVIDVLYIQNRQIKMGAPIFRIQNKMKKRIVFEHSADNQMTIRYHKKFDRIVFDHLNTSNDRIDRHPEFRGSDLSYDALEWAKNKWVFVQKVDVNSPRTKQDKKYVEPEGNPFGN